MDVLVRFSIRTRAEIGRHVLSLYVPCLLFSFLLHMTNIRWYLKSTNDLLNLGCKIKEEIEERCAQHYLENKIFGHSLQFYLVLRHKGNIMNLENQFTDI